MQRNMRAFFSGADCSRVGLFASAAFPNTFAGAFALQLGCFVHNAAMRADQAIRPADRLKWATSSSLKIGSVRLMDIKASFRGIFMLYQSRYGNGMFTFTALAGRTIRAAYS